jgi:flagellar biosynthesis chaperone FliJ
MTTYGDYYFSQIQPGYEPYVYLDQYGQSRQLPSTQLFQLPQWQQLQRRVNQLERQNDQQQREIDQLRSRLQWLNQRLRTVENRLNIHPQPFNEPF